MIGRVGRLGPDIVSQRNYELQLCIWPQLGAAAPQGKCAADGDATSQEAKIRAATDGSFAALVKMAMC